jgi:hypothetical protein
MQAFDLINCVEFQVFSKLWAEDETLELAFADWLQDQGLELQAEAVVEASKVNYPGVDRKRIEKVYTSGCYRPWVDDEGNYVWGHLILGGDPFRSQLSEEIFYKLKIKKTKYPTEIIASYLDAYADVKKDENAQRTAESN